MKVQILRYFRPVRLLLLFLCFPFFCHGQASQTYKVRTIAFYNVENLFDTTNDSLIFDDARTPEGRYQWTPKRYHHKIDRITEVIAQIGTAVTQNTPDIIGLCEVENKKVLNDLIQHPRLQHKNYGIIHFDSPDDRGIDVALLYKRSAFIPANFKSHRLLLFDIDGKRDYTRDQLVVSGYLDGELMHFLVNHWPSRSGGASKSEPNRVKAAQLSRRLIDSLQRVDSKAKIILMGDLNDDPRDDSLKKVLHSKGKLNELDSMALFNPMQQFYKKGLGSLAYRDQWNLFDQFLLTPSLTDPKSKTFRFWKAGIFNPKFLQNPSGQYKGYPYRTYVGTVYQGGYSDHFPVYIYLIARK